jgi:hypothetical protein
VGVLLFTAALSLPFLVETKKLRHLSVPLILLSRCFSSSQSYSYPHMLQFYF